ncbi:hypothetical protein [Puniceicoccus vermicola]|uniref:Uncharacterized protein n=1 Tax=Puniceicoccus vermicola TaxID=388746 RepID=A0A7X1AY05_9BACT|nr:hypothetical protein [Puniceicoccus vermicola]MBC2602081.1 hypothetical protein [Puniceicoccus vermicola]
MAAYNTEFLAKVFNFQENFENSFADYFDGLDGLRCFTTFADEELPENFLAVQFALGGANGGESTALLNYDNGQLEEDIFNGELTVQIVTRRNDAEDLNENPLPSIIRFHSQLRAKVMARMLRGQLHGVNLPSFYSIVTLNHAGVGVSIEEDNWVDISAVQYNLQFQIRQWDE